MASQRQIEANRRNARKSTGPRSSQGKRRAARNALRHGFSLGTGILGDDGHIETLAQRICADLQGESPLPDARAAARAQLTLAQIRVLKAEIVNRIFLFGAIGLQPRFRSAPLRFATSFNGQQSDPPSQRPARIDRLGPMPSDTAARMGDALWRSTEQLRKLDRYERRAHARLLRATDAIFALASRKK